MPQELDDDMYDSIEEDGPDEYCEEQRVCNVCGVILDRTDDEVFTCNNIRCQRTWGDRVEEHEEKRRERLIAAQEY